MEPIDLWISEVLIIPPKLLLSISFPVFEKISSISGELTTSPNFTLFKTLETSEV
jgi:hypothetical protein